MNLRIAFLEDLDAFRKNMQTRALRLTIFVQPETQLSFVAWQE